MRRLFRDLPTKRPRGIAAQSKNCRHDGWAVDRATASSAAYLMQAEIIGQNILKHRVRNGWFVPGQSHLFCRLGNDESQALLHLSAALMGKVGTVPAFTGAQPFFQAEYGNSSGRVYDSAGIYGKTR